MRVLHVVDSLEPGGMENGVVNLARELAPRGFETRVACLVRRGAFAERLSEPGHAVALGKGGGFSPAVVWRLARHIARCRPHIIHTHNLGPLIYASLATGFGLRCPILHGEHSQLTADERTPRRLRQRRWLYRACRHVHAVSDGVRHELLSLGFSPAKISVIPNGVDTARFAPGDRAAARRTFHLPEHAAVLGIVGRFGAFKRHDVLLDAFDAVASEFPDLHLLIVGAGGPQESMIRQRAETSLHARRIQWAGFQSDPLASYQALDLLALPSVNEGLSNAALEAMACAIPVLANLGCGHEQIITNGRDGVIADLHTPAALAAQLALLLRDPARLVDLGRNARTKVAAEFSLTAMIAAYEHLYRAVIR